MPKLRGHHLICLHFFQGEGYDAGYVKNLTEIVIEAEVSPVIVSPGNDDVCCKCPHAGNNECRYNDHSDDEIREMDRKALSLLDAKPGTETDWKEIREHLPSVFRAWYESCCIACGWKRSCDKNETYRELSASMK